MLDRDWRRLMGTGLVAPVLLLLPAIAYAGNHSGSDEIWILGGMIWIGLALAAGFLYVLVGNINAIRNNKPSIILGTIAMVLGGLDLLSIIRMHGSGSIQSQVLTLLMGGGFCYLGYRNIDMAKKRQDKERVQPPPTQNG